MKLIKYFIYIFLIGSVFNLYFSLSTQPKENLAPFLIYIVLAMFVCFFISLLFSRVKLIRKNSYFQIISIFLVASFSEIIYFQILGISWKQTFSFLLLGLPMVLIGLVSWYIYTKRLNENLKIKQKKLEKYEGLK